MESSNIENIEITKNKSLFKCSCGCKVSENSSRKHLRSQKHINIMKKYEEERINYDQKREEDHFKNMKDKYNEIKRLEDEATKLRIEAIEKGDKWRPTPKPKPYTPNPNYWKDAIQSTINIPAGYDVDWQDKSSYNKKNHKISDSDFFID